MTVLELQIYISELLSDLRPLTKEGQQIVYTHEGEAKIMMDKKSLRHILFNLLSNAIKFSPENGKISISSQLDKKVLLLSIKDDGIGISDVDQKHLFERFFRGRNAGNIQGTGLGLHIVSKYVEFLNGTIDFSSEENKGTTFTIVIPR